MKIHTNPFNFLDDALSDGTEASASRLFSFIAVLNAVGVVWVPLAIWVFRTTTFDYSSSLLAAQLSLAGVLLGPTLLAQYGAKREETKTIVADTAAGK